MAAENGNELWRIANKNSVGKPRIFKTPEDLWVRCIDYFEHIDNNPIIRKVTTIGEKGIFVAENEHKRPYTWEGLYLFLGVESLDRYRENPEYAGILTRIRQAIYSQKLEGAAAGVFNANIIARDLGLTEKKHIEVKEHEMSNPKPIKVQIVDGNEDQ